MKKKKNKKSTKQKLINLLKYRIKSLEIEKQLYEQNPTVMKNIKMANIELIQGDLAVLKKLLSDIMRALKKSKNRQSSLITAIKYRLQRLLSSVKSL